MEQAFQERRKSPRGDAAWRIETIGDLATLQRNAWRWLELERESADPDAAFQSFAWCSAWAQTWCKPGSNAKLAVKLIYRGDTLVALLPMMVQKAEGVRKLTILGAPHTQIANVLVRAGSETVDGIRLAIAETEFASGADVVQLGLIPENSPLKKALGFEKLTLDPASPISLLTWPGISTGEGYLGALSKNRRKVFRRKLRMLEKLGDVSFETIDASSDSFSRRVQTALDWKRLWLAKNKMLSGSLTKHGVDAFLTALDTHDGSFMPEADVLHIGNDPIAIAINLTGNGCRHGWLSAYDDTFSAMSPGTLVHQMSIAGSIDAGLSSYSFLGNPTAFKQAMSSGSVPLLRFEKPLTPRGAMWLKSWSNGIRPLAVKSLRRVWKWVK